MNKIKIAVLAGGLSNEREVSLKTSAQIIANLSQDKYEVSRVEVNPGAAWINELQAHKPDLVFIGLHGTFGEDGRTQAVLEYLGLRYTGSGVLSSALAMDKIKTYKFLQHTQLNIPAFISINREQMAAHPDLIGMVQKEVGYPCVVKPSQSGSSVGVSIVEKGELLSDALAKAFDEDGTAIIQKCVVGRELTCGVLGNSDLGGLIPLPPVEIVPHTKFFDYAAKYENKSDEICPAQIGDDLTKKVQEAAMLAHRSLGCRGLSRSDFIYSDDKLYFLETNTLPGMTEQSLCPKEAKALGWSFPNFLDKQIELAMK